MFPLAPPAMATTSSARALRLLYNTIARSTHKLLFALTCPGTWKLVRVAWDEVDRYKARTTGVFPIQQFRPHFQETPRRAPVDCNYIPDLVEWMPDTNTHVQRDVNPQRRISACRKNPNLSWPTQDLNLAEHLIHGPFDFSKLQPPAYIGPGPAEPRRVANLYWCILEDRASTFGIDVSNIQTVPVSNS